MGGLIIGWMYGWMGVWMNGWMDAWMDGWISSDVIFSTSWVNESVDETAVFLSECSGG